MPCESLQPVELVNPLVAAILFFGHSAPSPINGLRSCNLKMWKRPRFANGESIPPPISEAKVRILTILRLCENAVRTIPASETAECPLIGFSGSSLDAWPTYM